MGTITFHPWPVRSDDVDHPDELRIDLDPQPGTDFDDAVRVAAEARGLLDDLGYTGFPKTSGGRGVHIYVRIEPRWTFTDVRHAAIAFGRELERRLPGPGDDEVVEGGARRAHLRRLQPERPRPHDRLGLQRAAEAGRAGLRAARPGTSSPRSRPRTSPSRRCPRASPSSATATPRSTTSPTRCSRCSTCTSATRPRARRRHAVSARLPEDARRAEARAAVARPRPPPLTPGATATAAASSRRACVTGADGGGTTGPMSPSGASSRSTITGAWSLGPLALAGLAVDPRRLDAAGDRAPASTRSIRIPRSWWNMPAR